MGFLSKLFGGEEHPPLDPATPEGAAFERHRDVAVAFAGRLKDRLEVVPGEKVLYAFIGNPPDAFGIAWFEGGDEHNLKTLMKAKGLSQLALNRISKELREAYVKHKDAPRFAVATGKKTVVVTPSAALERDLVRIIHEATD